MCAWFRELRPLPEPVHGLPDVSSALSNVLFDLMSPASLYRWRNWGLTRLRRDQAELTGICFLTSFLRFCGSWKGLVLPWESLWRRLLPLCLSWHGWADMVELGKWSQRPLALNSTTHSLHLDRQHPPFPKAQFIPPSNGNNNIIPALELPWWSSG